MKALRLVVLFSLCALAAPARAQDPTEVWNALWQPAFDASKSAVVKDLVLARDGVRLTLNDGTIQFVKPTNGVVFGATFHGNGRLQVEPPNKMEAQQLQLFIKQNSMDMQFTDATFSFSDNTFKEVSGKVQWTGTGAANDDLYANRQKQREDLGAGLVPRLYKAVLSSDHARTAMFVADVKTREKNWVQVRADAQEPEEISIGRWMDIGVVKNFDTWLSFSATNRNPGEAFADPLAKDDYLIRSYRIDAAVTGGAELSATSRVTLEPRLAGERVLLFYLDSNLRVDSVKDAQGKTLTFFQSRENKDRFQSYGDYIAVTLPEPTQAGKSEALEFHYAGKRVVRRVGNGNYFCESFGWYPARLATLTGADSFASRADFEINFRSPKKFTLVATGNKINETTDGDLSITTWKSDVPLAVAGFAFGDYKVYSEKAGNVEIDVYANRQPDDNMRGIEQIVEGSLPGQSSFGMPAMGSLSPSVVAKTMGSELANTVRVFELYFGPYPYKHLAITNIPFSYGQGWPGLIYLSALSFLDSTQRNALGIRDQVWFTDFWRGHESSHQWWGHRVGWKSYHDQWLSEGFAEFSGNLYVQFRENQKEYLSRVRKGKQDLTARDVHSRTYESVGPVWMGLRLASSESPNAYRMVVYAKGGYVLHMLRMMMSDPRNANDPDQRFRAMMQDFCRTYENKPASTEDFKAIVEKYMTQVMDIEHNHRMDWFFRQYVYGTGIPQYEFRYQAQDAGDGKWKISGALNRSGVPDGWMDILPVYMRRGSAPTRLGFITATQAQTPFDVTLPFKPEKLSLNDFEDILADIKQ